MSSPFVYWGQKVDSITLRIEAKCGRTQPPEVKVTDQDVRFRAIVQDGDESSEYSFRLRLFDQILCNKFKQIVNDRQVEIVLKKKSPNIWPRLTECTLRRHWLRVDFDRLCPNPSDDDDLSDLFDSDSEEMTSTYRANSSSLAGMLGYGNDRKSIINWQNEPRSFVERMRLIYLVIFNLIQLFGYLIILSVFSLHYSRSGPNTFVDTYKKLGGLFKFLSCIRCLHPIHTAFGFHPGSTQIGLFQSVYRLFVVVVLIDGNERLQQRPIVIFFILINSLCDAITCLYYALRTCDLGCQTITWLRCTLWVPCYPLLFLFEGLLFLRTLPVYERSDRFSIHLPNWLNVSFHMSIFLKLYLFLAFIPVMYVSMNRLYKHRLQVYAN